MLAQRAPAVMHCNRKGAPHVGAAFTYHRRSDDAGERNEPRFGLCLPTLVGSGACSICLAECIANSSHPLSITSVNTTGCPQLPLLCGYLLSYTTASILLLLLIDSQFA
jgi:hypothetical protein